MCDINDYGDIGTSCPPAEEGGEGGNCDDATCCNSAGGGGSSAATCDSFSSCDHATLNKGSGVACSGNAATCDTATCCNAKATCTSFSSCSSSSLNKGSGTSCTGASSTCDAATCCNSAGGGSNAGFAPTDVLIDGTPALVSAVTACLTETCIDDADAVDATCTDENENGQSACEGATAANGNACVYVVPDGSCPIFANRNVPTGHGSGKYGAIGTWDVSQVTDMVALFENYGDFNADISNWNTARVVKMNNSTCAWSC